MGNELFNLWRSSEARLKRYVAQSVHDRSAIDDILQDVFVKAHVSYSDLRSPELADRWLFRITRNTVIDYHRRLRRSGALPANLTEHEPDSTVSSELASCVRPLISVLPEKYREALIISELEGLGQRKVAEHLGITLSGAKSRVQRGRRKLLSAITECCKVQTGANGIIGFEMNSPASCMTSQCKS